MEHSIELALRLGDSGVSLLPMSFSSDVLALPERDKCESGSRKNRQRYSGLNDGSRKGDWLGERTDEMREECDNIMFNRSLSLSIMWRRQLARGNCRSIKGS